MARSANLYSLAQVTPPQGASPRRTPRLSVVRAVQARALANGGDLDALLRVTWNVAGKCERPVSVELHARPDQLVRYSAAWSQEWRKRQEALKMVQKHFPGAELSENNSPIEKRLHVVEQRNQSATVFMEVPCRKCPRCLRRRGWLWTQRAKRELAVTHLAGHRTWFGTLTCRPDVHHLHLATARARLDAQGVVYERLSPDDQFRERYRALAIETTKWLKRVRKRSGAKLRYLCVVEVHLGGGANHDQPHLHLLIHEQDAVATIGERDLRETWPHGHTKFKLVADIDGAVYLCKYLQKDARARVRASERYGQD